MDKIKTIKSETEELLKKIIDKFELEVNEDQDIYHVLIKAEEEAPTVIGRHGETIRAVQKILEVVLYKKLGESIRVLVNVNDYREKQKERLESLAMQAAAKTLESRETNTLRGLSSYERRIIHEFITKNYPELTSYSIDEGKERKLVVDIKKEEASA